jgi:hypothetical protein
MSFKIRGTKCDEFRSDLHQKTTQTATIIVSFYCVYSKRKKNPYAPLSSVISLLFITWSVVTLNCILKKWSGTL